MKCVFCHDDILSLLTVAHHHHKQERLANQGQPGINDAYLLCWSCHHGLLHHGIITIEEVRVAAAETQAGTRAVAHDEVYRQIRIDLANRKRKAKPDFDRRTPEEKSSAARLAIQNRTPEARSAAARLAWKHRSRRRGSAQNQLPAPGACDAQ